MKLHIKKETVNHFIRSTYWFLVGFMLSGAILFAAVLFYFQHAYKDRVIPGVFVDNVYIGEKTDEEIREIFNSKNQIIQQGTFVFATDELEATVSAELLGIGYDVNLILEQGLNLGKTKNLLSDIYIIASSYVNGTFLNSSYTFDLNKFQEELNEIEESIFIEPINAKFEVENGRVVTFLESTNGQEIDTALLIEDVNNHIPNIVKSQNPIITRINIPIKITEPETTTEEANNLGIVEIIGEGKSTYRGSIPNRAYNISLATSRTSGVIVAPGEEFSFAKSIGDISRFTGYKEAYVISGGRTILGDGGGVCQVSTTIFRAALNAGLPITERNPHSYRVGYYEQDALPGLDATIYVPSVDLKFKNDTGNHILILGYADPVNMSMSFTIYGKRDGREVVVTDPIITNVSSPPEPSYQDDPSIPEGEVRQVEYAAPGARSEFKRTVTRDGEVIISDTFVSNYTPWRAVFLRGVNGES